MLGNKGDIMSTLKTVLKEENKRLHKLQKRYQKEIRNLPKGSLSIKNRKGRKYAYLAYRENDTIKTDYIGRLDSDSAKEMKILIKKRKELEALLKKTNQRITEVKKVLK